MDNNKLLKEKEQEFKGEEWIKNYNAFLKEVNIRYDELQHKRALYDLQQQDILHYIENKKCDAIISAKLMKKLKEVREKRRAIKEELAALTSIRDSSRKSKYKNKTTYTFKTNVIIDLLEEKEE